LQDEEMRDLNSDPTIETIYSAEAISARLEGLAGEIAVKKPQNLLVVPILKGSFVFAADLIRALHAAGLAPEVDFLTLSSYRKSRVSSGQVSILRDLDVDVQRRHVILIDDVLDSGRTLAFAKDLISARGATLIETCVLLRAPYRSSLTTVRSNAPTCSWSDMAWTWPTVTASCPSWAASSTKSRDRVRGRAA
jgi:hypoxanthine phosphoribosyltransferase